MFQRGIITILLIAFIIKADLADPVSACVKLQHQPQWKKAFDIGHFTRFLELNADDSTSLDQIKNKIFLPLNLKKNDRAVGQSHSVMITWLTFSIENGNAQDTIRLYYDCNMQGKIELFNKSGLFAIKGLWQGINGRTLTLLVICPRTTETYWVKITNQYETVLPIISQLQTETSYANSALQEKKDAQLLLLVLSMMCGCFLFMSIYAVYNFYINRDAVFFYYGVYTLICLVNGLFAINMRFVIVNLSPVVFPYLIAVSYTMFIANILDLSKLTPKAWVVLKALVIVGVFQQILNSIEILILSKPIFSSNLYYSLSFWPSMIMFIASLIFVVKSRHVFRNYLIIGVCSVVAIGLIPFILNYYFTIESKQLEMVLNYPSSFWLLGLMIESICFALALSYRAKQSEDEKKKLQENYADQLERDLAIGLEQMAVKNNELEQQHIKHLTAEFEKQLIATEMTGLRAQMNPHFIFNCLNSIKLYTLENDSIKAADYLTKFARLIRLVLENSSSEKISLAAELETLQLYVDMECMRFKNKFKYQLNIDSNVDPDYIDLPPLLIQPYIENAIWHGLLHKGDNGLVTLSIHQPDEQTLTLEITDNGIGRTHATTLKSKSATHHKSFGMKMNSDRIALINQLHNNVTKVEIHDLVDNNGNPAGTNVNLTIPIS